MELDEDVGVVVILTVTRRIGRATSDGMVGVGGLIRDPGWMFCSRKMCGAMIDVAGGR